MGGQAHEGVQAHTDVAEHDRAPEGLKARQSARVGEGRGASGEEQEQQVHDGGKDRKRKGRQMRELQRAPYVFPAEGEHDQQQQRELEAAAPADEPHGGERLQQDGGIDQRDLCPQIIPAQKERTGGAQPHADQTDQHHQIEIAEEKEYQQNQVKHQEKPGSPGQDRLNELPVKRIHYSAAPFA